MNKLTHFLTLITWTSWPVSWHQSHEQVDPFPDTNLMKMLTLFLWHQSYEHVPFPLTPISWRCWPFSSDNNCMNMLTHFLWHQSYGYVNPFPLTPISQMSLFLWHQSYEHVPFPLTPISWTSCLLSTTRNHQHKMSASKSWFQSRSECKTIISSLATWIWNISLSPIPPPHPHVLSCRFPHNIPVMTSPSYLPPIPLHTCHDSDILSYIPHRKYDISIWTLIHQIYIFHSITV